MVNETWSNALNRQITIKMDAHTRPDQDMNSRFADCILSVNGVPTWAVIAMGGSYGIYNLPCDRWFESYCSLGWCRSMVVTLASYGSELFSGRHAREDYDRDALTEFADHEIGLGLGCYDQYVYCRQWANAEYSFISREMEMMERKRVAELHNRASENGMELCDHCEKEFETITCVDGVQYCDDCLSENCSVCDDCGEMTNAELQPVYLERSSGRTREIHVCGSCERNYYNCESCGCNVHSDYMHSDPDVCFRCLDRNYFTCESCDGVYHNDNYGHDGRCYDCVSDGENRLHSHSYTPLLHFYHVQSKPDQSGKNKRVMIAKSKPVNGVPYWFGTELETSSGQCSRSLSDMIDLYTDKLDSAGLSNFAYLKEDGSISGFEIVTHPFSWEWFKHDGHKYTDTFEILKRHGMRSFNADDGSCGMHVHVSNSAFADGMTLYKTMQLLYGHPDFTLEISRRKSHDLKSWANCSDELSKRVIPSAVFNRKLRDRNRDSVRWENGRMITISKPVDWGRYNAINLLPSNTVEFRIFRGTLNPIGFCRNIEFVRAVIEFARIQNVKGMNPKAFIGFVSDHSKTYKNLAEFYVNRGSITNTEQAC